MVSGVYRPSEKGTPNRVFTSKLVGLSKYVCALYKQDHSEFILTFDWDGNPLNSYKLPCHLYFVVYILYFMPNFDKRIYSIC